MKDLEPIGMEMLTPDGVMQRGLTRDITTGHLLFDKAMNAC